MGVVLFSLGFLFVPSIAPEAPPKGSWGSREHTLKAPDIWKGIKLAKGGFMSFPIYLFRVFQFRPFFPLSGKPNSLCLRDVVRFT